MKIIINLEQYKNNLQSVCSIPLYEKAKNIIFIDKNSITKLRLNIFDSYFYNQSNIKEKNILFIEKLNFLYSRYGRKIILELNVTPDEIETINWESLGEVCFVEDDGKILNQNLRELMDFYKGIYKSDCNIVELLKNLIGSNNSTDWKLLAIIKEYILLGTGEIIKRIQKNENQRINFNSEEPVLFDENIYIENTVKEVNDYLKAFYSFLKNTKEEELLKEKYNRLKEEIKSEYARAFSSEMRDTAFLAMSSFVREGVHLGIILKNMLNDYRGNTNLSNTYRSQLSYISKFKRMISSDFIKETISNIKDENIKIKMGDLFSKYNECKFFFDSYKTDYISFTDIEDFSFYFQRLSVINLNLSEKVFTLTTEELKKVFNNFNTDWYTNFNQPRYNIWCIPYIATGKPEIVVMIDKNRNELYKIMRNDDPMFNIECQSGLPYILESIIPIL